MPYTDWWAWARLCLTAERPGFPAHEIASGPLLDMLLAAAEVSEDKRHRLHVNVIDSHAHLGWPKIVELLDRGDRPRLI